MHFCPGWFLVVNHRFQQVRCDKYTHILPARFLTNDILSKWNSFEGLFRKVMPRDYRKVLDALKRVEEKGLTGDEAALAAFHEAVS